MMSDDDDNVSNGSYDTFFSVKGKRPKFENPNIIAAYNKVNFFLEGIPSDDIQDHISPELYALYLVYCQGWKVMNNYMTTTTLTVLFAKYPQVAGYVNGLGMGDPINILNDGAGNHQMINDTEKGLSLIIPNPKFTHIDMMANVNDENVLHMNGKHTNFVNQMHLRLLINSLTNIHKPEIEERANDTYRSLVVGGFVVCTLFTEAASGFIMQYFRTCLKALGMDIICFGEMKISKISHSICIAQKRDKFFFTIPSIIDDNVEIQNAPCPTPLYGVVFKMGNYTTYSCPSGMHNPEQIYNKKLKQMCIELKENRHKSMALQTWFNALRSISTDQERIQKLTQNITNKEFFIRGENEQAYKFIARVMEKAQSYLDHDNINSWNVSNVITRS